MMFDLNHENDNEAIVVIKAKIKKRSVDVFDLLGIMSVLLYSKVIFKKNIDVAGFIDNILNVQLPNYVVKSRTLMVARCARIIFNADQEQIKGIHYKLISYFEKFDIEKPVIKKTKKKKNENEKLETWLKGL